MPMAEMELISFRLQPTMTFRELESIEQNKVKVQVVQLQTGLLSTGEQPLGMEELLMEPKKRVMDVLLKLL